MIAMPVMVRHAETIKVQVICSCRIKTEKIVVMSAERYPKAPSWFAGTDFRACIQHQTAIPQGKTARYIVPSITRGVSVSPVDGEVCNMNKLKQVMGIRIMMANRSVISFMIQLLYFWEIFSPPTV